MKANNHALKNATFRNNTCVFTLQASFLPTEVC